MRFIFRAVDLFWSARDRRRWICQIQTTTQTHPHGPTDRGRKKTEYCAVELSIGRYGIFTFTMAQSQSSHACVAATPKPSRATLRSPKHSPLAHHAVITQCFCYFPNIKHAYPPIHGVRFDCSGRLRWGGWVGVVGHTDRTQFFHIVRVHAPPVVLSACVRVYVCATLNFPSAWHFNE